MSYDSSLTVFSPEGHLIQVQYAHKAVARGTSAVGLVCDQGIVLSVEKKQAAKLQDTNTNMKIFRIDDHIWATYSGLTADARKLIQQIRYISQEYRLTYDTKPSVKVLVKKVAGYMQEFTQKGGRRPFGVSLIICGKDQSGYSLWMVDPSGVFFRWKGVAVGNQSEKIQEHLSKNYKDGMSLAELETLAKDAVGLIVDNIDDGIDTRTIVME